RTKASSSLIHSRFTAVPLLSRSDGFVGFRCSELRPESVSSTGLTPFPSDAGPGRSGPWHAAAPALLRAAGPFPGCDPVSGRRPRFRAAAPFPDGGPIPKSWVHFGAADLAPPQQVTPTL